MRLSHRELFKTVSRQDFVPAIARGPDRRNSLLREQEIGHDQKLRKVFCQAASRDERRWDVCRKSNGVLNVEALNIFLVNRPIVRMVHAYRLKCPVRGNRAIM